MKLKRNFTLIELLVVITIIGILAGAMGVGISSAMDKAKAVACAGNLKDLGLGMIEYKLEEGYFPCGLKDTDTSDSVITRKIKGPRSTVTTLQTYRDEDGEELDLNRFFCPVSGKRAPRKHTDSLRKSNVGYHYTDGNVSERILKANMALMRDLNEGHSEAEFGQVLLGNGGVKRIDKQGRESNNRPGNYKVNWFRNKDIFINYKDFKSYSRSVNMAKPDDCD